MTCTKSLRGKSLGRKHRALVLLHNFDAHEHTDGKGDDGEDVAEHNQNFCAKSENCKFF